MKWQVVTTEVEKLWTVISQHAQGATFFHTPAWSEILEITFDSWQNATIAVEFSDGNLVVLPQMRRKLPNPFNGYTESMLPGVYGGPLFFQTPNEEHWKVVWNIVSGLSDTIVYGNPYLQYVGEPSAIRRSKFTQVLDLTPGFDEIWRGFRKGHRADVKAARREGVEVTPATSLQEVNDYYKTYQDALERWGKGARGFYPRELFYNLFHRPEYGEATKLWAAHLSGEVIGGAWVLYHNNHAVYWHAVVHSEYMFYHPAHLLVATAIEDACDRGFHWFDFNPSGGLKGVVHFKKGFGAQRLEFSAYRRLSLVGKAFRLYRYLKERYLRTCSL